MIPSERNTYLGCEVNSLCLQADQWSWLQEYCINRDQFDFILDVTKFKTKAGWGEDPLKDVPAKLKAAFTRTFNVQGLRPKTNTMVEEVKGRGKVGQSVTGGCDTVCDVCVVHGRMGHGHQ